MPRIINLTLDERVSMKHLRLGTLTSKTLPTNYLRDRKSINRMVCILWHGIHIGKGRRHG
jgi:hypothetical protein